MSIRQATTMAAQTPRRGGVTRLLRVALRGQTYRNILYLLAAFPLGLLYFLVLVVGLSVGLGTAVIGIGVLLLILVIGFTWAMAAAERQLVHYLLAVEITAPAGPDLQGLSPWKAFVARLRHSSTWKSMAYLLVEFPFGVVSFSLVVALLPAAIGLLLAPVAYLLSLPGAQGIGLNDIFFQFVRPPMGFDPIEFVATVLVGVLGVPVAIGSLYAFNGMAYAWGQFARLMLGTSVAQARLAEARATAAREQARAEQSDQRRRELIVNVSHELRTPIANIRGHVESLRMAGDAPPPVGDTQAYLGIVAREAERLSSLVDDLLALARAEADELQLDVRPTAIGAVVDEVYAALAPLAQRDRRVTLVRNIAPDLPPALADRDRLIQVLLNLARNAITATPEGGLVFLDLEREDESHIALIVSDTGRGISPQDLARIFDRFYRADTSRSRATGGFGLGLSIVRDLVQAMGGTISVSSTVGAGSCFRVVLRAAPEAGQVA
jgi:signal transduction histidine kinase